MAVDMEDIPLSQEHDSPYAYRRPEMSGRGGSLLDRLSLDQHSDARGAAMPSPSLRDRVQVPLKRDREDMMMNEQFPTDNSFEGEDGFGDSNFKRARRRSGKLRRPRRGGP